MRGEVGSNCTQRRRDDLSLMVLGSPTVSGCTANHWRTSVLQKRNGSCHSTGNRKFGMAFAQLRFGGGTVPWT